MIINITQHCTLRCPHCMQNASPERTERMIKETFLHSLEFAKSIGSRVINISGGECTTHPDFLEFVKEAVSNRDFFVSILSNGTFIRNRQLSDKISKMIRENSNLYLQISSFKGLYANYDEIHKPGLKAIRASGSRCAIYDENNTKIKMRPMGRAASGEWYEVAKKDNGFPSCINAALIAAQNPGMRMLPGAVLESNLRFCIPLVSWDGSIRMGEGEQCKVIANVHDNLDDVCAAIASFRPCKGCAAYHWHFDNPTTGQELQEYRILGLDK